MKIGFDIDGVLADFAAVAVEFIRRMFLPDLPPGYTQQAWCFQDIITKEQWERVFAAMLATKDLWLTVPPYQNNVDALRHYVAQAGEDDIYLITARKKCVGGSQATMTQLWLMDQGLPFSNLFVVKDHSDKRALIQELGIKFFVDDLPQTIQECLTLEDCRPYLMNQNYNRDADLPRVYSVDEFLLETSIGA